MGTKTLLDGVNEVLKKVQIVSSGNLLTSLTNSGKQVFIDNAVQAWREGTQELYRRSNIMKPNQAKEGTITLATDTREYTLATDAEQIHFPFHDETNAQYIQEYPGGYEELRASQTSPDNFTGLPRFGVISPIDGKLYVDYTPTASENGNIYKYYYWKSTDLETYDDTFPFSNDVFWAMVPVVADIWRILQYNKTNEGYRKLSFGRARELLKKIPPSPTWISRSGTHLSSPLGHDPFDDRKY